MATTKITDLTAYTDPISTDVVPIVDVTSDVTKKVSIADLMENAGSGTEALPGISFDGDPNTGIYRPGADQVAISTAGSGRLFVDASGNVGVGGAPSHKLDVLNSNNTTYTAGDFVDQASARIHNNSTTTNSFASLAFRTASADNAIGFLYTGTTNQADFIIANDSGLNGVERLRITSDGKVGVGTSTPGVKFEAVDSVNNITAKIENTDTTNGYGLWVKGGGSASGRYIAKFTDAANNDRLFIGANGSVGIGTSSPSFLFSVEGSSGSTTVAEFKYSGGNNVYLKLANASNAQGFIGYESSDLTFYTNNTEKARIDSSGRLLVGVNLDTSTDRLIVQGRIGENGGHAVVGLRRGSLPSAGDQTIATINFADNSNNQGAQISAVSDGGAWTSGSNHRSRLVFLTTADGLSSPTERMSITSAGQVFVGTTTGSLSSNGIILGNSGDLFCSISSGNTYHVYSNTSSSYKFYVNENGGISNYSANNQNLSDEREKKNIETLDSTWDCLKAWELKKFHYNEDADTDDKRYGVIAQQVAPHCPEVISQWIKQPAQDAELDDDGNVVTPATEEVTRMGVKEQQMMWMAIKALQEAQTRIETLEAEVAALKGA